MKPTKDGIQPIKLDHISTLKDIPTDIKSNRLPVVTRTPSQIARGIMMEELLRIGPTGTPLFSTDEIVERVSEKFPDWLEELKKKGYDLHQAEKRMIVAVHRKCEQMLKDGISAGFLPRQGRKPGVVKMPTGMEFTPIGRIVLWFRSPENVERLSWRECEEIVDNISKYRNKEPEVQAQRKFV